MSDKVKLQGQTTNESQRTGSGGSRGPVTSSKRVQTGAGGAGDQNVKRNAGSKGRLPPNQGVASRGAGNTNSGQGNPVPPHKL